jgi:hypothetical protein
MPKEDYFLWGVPILTRLVILQNWRREKRIIQFKDFKMCIRIKDASGRRVGSEIKALA